jgi:hypothetical protein
MYVETKNSQYQIILIWELTGVKEEKRYRYRIASMGGTFPKGSYWEGNTLIFTPHGEMVLLQNEEEVFRTTPLHAL